MQHWRRNIQFAFCGLALATLLGGVAPAFGQEPGPPPPGDMGPPPDFDGAPPGRNVDRDLARMVKRYGLSDEQKAEIRPILVDEKQKLDAIFKDSSLAPEDRSAKIKAIHSDEVARVSALLTDDQRAKYQKDETRARQNDDGMGPDGGPPGPPPGGDSGGGPPPPGN